jgi:hypothetical protein
MGWPTHSVAVTIQQADVFNDTKLIIGLGRLLEFIIIGEGSAMISHAIFICFQCTFYDLTLTLKPSTKRKRRESSLGSGIANAFSSTYRHSFPEAVSASILRVVVMSKANCSCCASTYRIGPFTLGKLSRSSLPIVWPSLGNKTFKPFSY